MAQICARCVVQGAADGKRPGIVRYFEGQTHAGCPVATGVSIHRWSAAANNKGGIVAMRIGVAAGMRC